MTLCDICYEDKRHSVRECPATKKCSFAICNDCAQKCINHKLYNCPQCQRKRFMSLKDKIVILLMLWTILRFFQLKDS